MTLPHSGRGGSADGGAEHGQREAARSEATRLATAEAEFRFAVQREQATLMASGLGRIQVSSRNDLTTVRTWRPGWYVQ